MIGAGGHAKEVVATLRAAGVDVEAVADDDPDRWGEEILGVPIRGPIESCCDPGTPAVLAIGDNAARRRLAEALPCDWRTAVHPTASIAEEVEIGPGSVVFAGSVLQPGSRLGRHVIVNTGASVSHDGRIGDFVHLGPGVRLAGNTTVGEGAFLGVASSAVPGRTVGPWSTVGAGAVVIDDVPERSVVVGVPARPLRS